MKKILIFFSITLGVNLTVIAQQPEFQWVRQFGAASNDNGLSIAVDAAGNVYTTGYFRGITDFDPGPGIFNLTAVGTGDDIFISKLDPAGDFVWAKQFGGTDGKASNSIAVDAAGNVYTTGYFSQTVDFDPGPADFPLSATGVTGDIFISKLDAAGDFVWAKRIGGTGGEQGNSIAVDAAGNVYTTGRYSQIVDFDPGPGTYNLFATEVNNSNIFVSKLDASGNFVWAKQLGSTEPNELGNSIVLDANGNIYLTGGFRDTADFDPVSGTFDLVSAGQQDIFVCKLNPSGNLVWAKQMGGTGGGNIGEMGISIAVDAVGNVYTTGIFESALADFDPGPGTYDLEKTGSFYDVFISKLDTAGDFVWAKRIGGTYIDEGYSIALDAAGNIYTTGYFSQTVDFDPGPGTFILTDMGDIYDTFICKLDAAGDFVWAEQFGGSSRCYSIAADAAGNIYTTGDFYGTDVDFNPGADAYNLTSANFDIFVLKLGGCGSSLVITASQDTICRGTPAVLDVTGATGDIQWQSSATGNNFTGISGATGANYISQDTANSYFRVYTSDTNCSDTSNVFKLVVQPSPVADFISNGSGTAITFTDKSKGATVYNWNFGDGSTGTEQNPVHTYTSPGSYRVCLTVFNGSNCSFTTCRDIDAGITTSVTDIFAQDNFILYPNPFCRSITIEQRNMNKPIQGIELYDLLGRKIYSEYPGTSNFKLQTSNFQTPNFKLLIEIPALPNGMYFVKVKTKNADYIDRVIKQ